MRCIKNNDLNVNSSSPVISSHGQQKQIDDNVDDAYVDDGDGHDRVGESKTVLSRPVRVKAVQTHIAKSLKLVEHAQHATVAKRKNSRQRKNINFF